MKKILSILFAAVVLCMGLTACSSNGPLASPATTQVSTVPQSCLDALDDAQAVMRSSARALEADDKVIETIPALLTAVAASDPYAFSSALDDLKEASNNYQMVYQEEVRFIKNSTFTENAAKCRSLSGTHS